MQIQIFAGQDITGMQVHSMASRFERLCLSLAFCSLIFWNFTLTYLEISLTKFVSTFVNFGYNLFIAMWSKTMMIIGPALMAEWSKALPLTASCHSPFLEFKSHLVHLRKLPLT